MTELSAMVGLYAEPVLRLLLAAALGGIIGLERQASAKPAGFRTNLLICVGAALLTELSIAVAANGALPGGLRSDPGRIAAQIVSGIGFLGAGTILQSRGSVTGLTTAATLWVVAAIGMSVGAGQYVLATATTFLVVIALTMLGRLDDRRLPGGRQAERTVRLVHESSPQLVASIEAALEAAGLHVAGVDVEQGEGEYVTSFQIRGRGDSMDRLVALLLGHEGVHRVTLL